METWFRNKKIEYKAPPQNLVLQIIKRCDDNPNPSIGYIPMLGLDMSVQIEEEGRVIWQRGVDPPPVLDVHHYNMFYHVGNIVIGGLLKGGNGEDK